ncbi:MAG: fused MFS/spermidine synthase [Myxococcota bacterium]
MRFAAFAAFFLSGASSLIFQSIWSRMLAKVFGASSVAISTVVTIFMMGLGIGAFVAGRRADRVKNPLLAYGIVEGIVGVWALLVPFLLDPEGWLAGVNGYLRVALGSGSLGFTVARFFCVLPILLVPTTLMGASLPLLSRYFVTRTQGQAQVGSWVGALYSVNTFGAVLGVLLGGFVLMPNIGVSLTNTTAAFINFALAAGIFLLRKPIEANFDAPPAEASSSGDDEEDGEEDADDRGEQEDEGANAGPGDDIALPVPPLGRYFALGAFVISGFASLCYEIVWSRSLAMTIGSSFQAFNLILATFLIGIGGGSAVASAFAVGRGFLTTAGVASLVLLTFTLSPWAVSEGVALYLGMVALFATPIAIVWVAAHLKEKRTAFGGVSSGAPVALMLAVPVLAAAAGAVNFEGDRISLIVGSVTVALSIFFFIAFAFRRYPMLQIALMPLFIGGAAFVNYLFQDEIPCAFAALVASLEDLPNHVGLVQFFMFLTTMMCTLPATVGMGAMFPMTLRIWTSGGGSVGRDVGNVYAGNTIGSVMGAWLPGFVLMQTYGMQKTIITGMVVYLLLSLVLLVMSAAENDDEDAGADNSDDSDATETSDGDTEDEEDADDEDATPAWYAATVYILAPLIPALIAVLVWGGWGDSGRFRWNLSRMTLGVFRVSLASDACSPSWGEPDLVYYHDGLSTTVSVERWGRHYALKNNGKVDASNGDDMPTQIMVGAYPLLLHRDGPEDLDVAVIGFGSGVTVGSVLKFPVESVDVIELERSIPDASKYFQDVNGLSYTLPDFPYVEMDRLTVINDDGRNYLSSTDREFDVIVSEPSNPWITGVSDLFTTDHFRITKQRLREGGIYCQWVQLYELSPENIKTIYRTFAESFEHVVVFSAEDLSSDTVLIGSDSPIDLNVQHLEEVYGIPGVADELGRAFVNTPYDVFARTLFASKEEVLQYAQIEHRLMGGEWQAFPDRSNPPNASCPEATCRLEPVPLNTDDNALIEFAAPRDLIGYQRYEGYLANIYSPEWPFGRLVGQAAGFGDGEEAAQRYAEMALSLIGHGRKAEAAAFVDLAERAGQAPAIAVAAEVLTRLMSPQAEPQVVIEEPVPGPQMATEQARVLREGFQAVRTAIDAGDYETAQLAMEAIPAPIRLHSGPSLRLLHAYLLYKTGPTYPSRFGEAVELLEDLARSEPDYVQRHPELFYFLGRAHDADLHFDKAVRNMRLYVETRIRIAAREANEQRALQEAAENTCAEQLGEDVDRESGPFKDCVSALLAAPTTGEAGDTPADDKAVNDLAD